jgi:hypothetical protein
MSKVRLTKEKPKNFVRMRTKQKRKMWKVKRDEDEKKLFVGCEMER